MYQPNSKCDVLCKEQLYGLNQTYLALGKLQKRVHAYVLSDAISTHEYSQLTASAITDQHLQADYLYLVDPLGKVIMQYRGSENREQTIQTSKFLLSDIRKLLKYARVG